jgi:hypothetical protein
MLVGASLKYSQASLERVQGNIEKLTVPLIFFRILMLYYLQIAEQFE